MVVTTESGPRLYLRNLGVNELWCRLTLRMAPRGRSGRPTAGPIGFFAATKLKRVSVNGGAPQTICDLSPPRSLYFKLASWGPDDTVLVTGIVAK